MTTDAERITRLETNEEAISARLDRIEGELAALRVQQREDSAELRAGMDALRVQQREDSAELRATINGNMRTTVIAGVTAGIGITGILLAAIIATA